MGPLPRDIRLALRWLLSHPGFSVTATVMLALAVGFSTALFSVVNGVLLRPLPYADPDRLVMVWERSPHVGGERNTVSPANAFAWRERTRTLADLAAVANDRVTLSGGDQDALELSAQRVTANVFAVLGVVPRLGRSFDAHEGEGSSAPVAVISDELWHRRFAADRSVVGRTVDIHSNAVTIIGVMPPGFSLLNVRADVWLPMVLHADWRGRYLSVIGRLRPGVSMAQASREFTGIAEQLAGEAPEFNAHWGATVVSMQEQLVGDVRPTLLAAVLLLLAIAYFNVGDLLLNRAVSRRKEIGLRLALGAGRGHLVRQFLAESACLAAAASILALLIALGFKVALEGLVTTDLMLPRIAEVTIDARVVAFLLFTSILATALFAVLPAWAYTGRDALAVLGGSDRASTGGRRQRRLRSVLVAGEVALALVLLVGAGLLVRTMQRLDQVELGMQTGGVLTFRVTLPGSRYGEEVRQREFYSAVLGRLDGIPGVRAAGAVRYLPLTGEQTASIFWPADAPQPKAGEEPVGDIRIVGGSYFDAMHIPLRRGRTFGSTDTESAPDVLVVNEALAAQLWPHADPIGKRVVVPWGKFVDGKDVPVNFLVTVVGVVGNDREESLAQPPAPAMYWWYRQHAEREMSFVVRTTGDPESVEGSVRAVVRQLDAGLAVAKLQAMTNVVIRSLVRPRATLTVLGVFATMALLLAALGLYGVVAYWVSNRTHELGVRVALGAQRRDVVQLVVWQALAPTIAGVVVGLALAVGATRVMRSLLYGVSPTDPLTLVSLAAFLCLVAVAAASVPGLRAARVDPATALRGE
jgi:putative ABC transport system permease protein